MKSKFFLLLLTAFFTLVQTHLKADTESTELFCFQDKIINCKRCEKTYFSYTTPSNISDGTLINLYLVVLENGCTIKQTQLKIAEFTGPNQKAEFTLKLKPNEVVFAILYSLNADIGLFDLSELGALSVKTKGSVAKELFFEKYDSNSAFLFYNRCPLQIDLY
jgi:hypothetical protein